MKIELFYDTPEEVNFLHENGFTRHTWEELTAIDEAGEELPTVPKYAEVWMFHDATLEFEFEFNGVTKELSFSDLPETIDIAIGLGFERLQ